MEALEPTSRAIFTHLLCGATLKQSTDILVVMAWLQLQCTTGLNCQTGNVDTVVRFLGSVPFVSWSPGGCQLFIPGNCECTTVATAVYEFVNSWCARTLAHRQMLEVAAAATGVNTCVLNRM